MFESLSIQEQESLLLQTLADLKTTETLLTELVSAWRAGDTAQFAQISLDSFRKHPQLQQTFLTDRNLNWLGTIESLFDRNQDYLVIVGAAHLVGEQGLVQLLNDRGYQFEQVQGP
ncbi:MAG: TraB/GumN family protein [Prochlorotrichaceae cyanobacterium]